MVVPKARLSAAVAALTNKRERLRSEAALAAAASTAHHLALPGLMAALEEYRARALRRNRPRMQLVLGTTCLGAVSLLGGFTSSDVDLVVDAFAEGGVPAAMVKCAALGREHRDPVSVIITAAITKPVVTKPVVVPTPPSTPEPGGCTSPSLITGRRLTGRGFNRHARSGSPTRVQQLSRLRDS